MRKSIIVTALQIAVVSITLAKPSAAQERFRFAWAGTAPASTPLWVANEKGFFKKYGLQPEIITISASTIVIQALLSGDVDVILGTSATLVTSRLAGADTILVSTNLPHFNDHIVSHANITGMDQLRGKVGVVNRIGTQSDLALRLTLKKFGIDPDKDAKILPAGGNPERLAALIKGAAHFTVMGEPFVKEAEKLGFKDLFDVGPLKIPFHVNCQMTRESTVKAKRPLIMKIVRAMAEGVHYVKTEKEGTKAVISKYTKVTDPEGLERAYKSYSAAFAEIPWPFVEGVKTVLDDMAPRDKKAAAADPKSFVDMSFVQELESQGFFKQLYKR